MSECELDSSPDGRRRLSHHRDVGAGLQEPYYLIRNSVPLKLESY